MAVRDFPFSVFASVGMRYAERIRLWSAVYGRLCVLVTNRVREVAGRNRSDNLKVIRLAVGKGLRELIKGAAHVLPPSCVDRRAQQGYRVAP
jgi:hypothetical protein